MSILNRTTTNGRDDLAKSIRHMVDEADHFLKTAGAAGDEKYDAVRARFGEQLRQMRAELADLEEGAIYRAKHAARAADQAVHTHPYGAIGIAAAAGLLIGFLAARR